MKPAKRLDEMTEELERIGGAGVTQGEARIWSLANEALFLADELLERLRQARRALDGKLLEDV